MHSRLDCPTPLLQQQLAQRSTEPPRYHPLCSIGEPRLVVATQQQTNKGVAFLATRTWRPACIRLPGRGRWRRERNSFERPRILEGSKQPMLLTECRGKECYFEASSFGCVFFPSSRHQCLRKEGVCDAQWHAGRLEYGERST